MPHYFDPIAQRPARPPKALILAAGEGTRLRPLTLDRPKPMVPIAGRPLLEHTVHWLRRYGVCEIAINLHYRPEAITSHFGDGAAFDVCITYSYEDPLLGTAGAVRKLAHFLGDGPFLVVYGDVLTDLDLRRLLSFHHAQAVREPMLGATVSLYHVPNPTEVGLVGMDAAGRIIRFVEKPRSAEVFTDLANTGVLVVEPAVIPHIPPDTFYDFGRDLFPKLLAAGVPLHGWVIPEGTYLLDIGTPEKYAQAQQDWANRRPCRIGAPADEDDPDGPVTPSVGAAGVCPSVGVRPGPGVDAVFRVASNVSSGHLPRS